MIKSFILAIAVAGLLISILFAALSSGLNKHEIAECKYWQTWKPDAHRQWLEWQRQQCLAHQVELP